MECEFDCLNMADMEIDPMDAITASEVADPPLMADVDDDQQSGAALVATRPGQQTPQVGQDGQIALCPSGIRTVLGRKQRPRPLLRLVCRGCSKSTHDDDPFVPGDSLEILGLMIDD